MAQGTPENQSLRVAVEGCGHGTLDAIYASILKSCEVRGWDGVDLVLIGGDFQAVRNRSDLNVTAMPAKYRQMADFHQYYAGKKIAPFLTIFIGGNHEASNHLFELYYGGWVAPNIYYLGAANVIQIGPLTVAGLSGIWKGYDYRKPHYERLPYNDDDIYSIYHVREIDVRKLLSYRSQVDVGLSHDWPKGIEWCGNHRQLFTHKPFLREDAESGKLGNTAAQEVMDRLRPPHWFSAHLHTRYTAVKSYGTAKPIEDSRKSAWRQFSENVRVDEAKESTRLMDEVTARRASADKIENSPAEPKYVINETYKRVKLENGLDRTIVSGSIDEVPQEEHKFGNPITQLDGCCNSVAAKRPFESISSSNDYGQASTGYTTMTTLDGNEQELSTESTALVTNPDAIDIDTSDDETTQLTTSFRKHSSAQREENDFSMLSASSTERHTAQDMTTNDQDMTNIETSPGNTLSNGAEQASRPEGVDGNGTEQSGDVSEEMRAQLAALSSKFEEPIQVSPALPHPENITNETTRFLALSKCEDRQNFLQLLEIHPYDTSKSSFQRPVKLQYVPEWLAIQRVFASELTLSGDRIDRTPKHKGDTYYRERILEEEKWISENVTQKGLLEVPLNFTVTASEYEEDAPLTSQDMPREVSNPQTSAFCKLIEIENKFDIAEEERDTRMATGPAEARDRGNRGRGGARGARGGHRAGRGGPFGGGRGRGNRGRGGGGRRGRGWIQ